MKSSELLRACKEYLWDGVSPRNEVLEDSTMICTALGYAWEAGFQSADPQCLKLEEVRKDIADRLEGSATYQIWLLAHHRDLYVQAQGVSRGHLYREVQRGRHAWVDALIAEYEAKGD